MGLYAQKSNMPDSQFVFPGYILVVFIVAIKFYVLYCVIDVDLFQLEHITQLTENIF